MPELPEVETVRRGLQPVLEGTRLAKVTLNRPDLRFPLPDRMVERLEGATITSLSRRAKFLVAETDRDERLVMHLGMSGRFTIETADSIKSQPGEFEHDTGVLRQHNHVVFETEAGDIITFNDPRRFGYMQMFTAKDADPFAEVGPEPISNSWDGAALHARLAGRASPMKAVLLDQKTVAGLGNIYVCEALFRSGISPRRQAKTLGLTRADKLVVAIKDVLNEAIEAGGSTLRDYAHTDGSLGYFQHRFTVYGREGEACVSCGSTVKRIVQSGRSTFYCGRCQR